MNSTILEHINELFDSGDLFGKGRKRYSLQLQKNFLIYQKKKLKKQKIILIHFMNIA